MKQSVVPATQEHSELGVGLSVLTPGDLVVGITARSGLVAPREGAAAVAHDQRPSLVGGEEAFGAPHVEGVAARVHHHRMQMCIAEKHRSCGGIDLRAFHRVNSGGPSETVDGDRQDGFDSGLAAAWLRTCAAPQQLGHRSGAQHRCGRNGDA